MAGGPNSILTTVGHHLRMFRRFVVPLFVVALFGGGCSSTGSSPQVATLHSAGPTASPAAERPVIALDATDQERDALWATWGACVTKEGGAGYENPRNVFRYEQQQNPKAKRVRAACLAKEPETYEDRQRRTDIAAFRDHQLQWYRCAKKAGYRLTTPDENGEFGITEVGPNGDFQSPKMEACRKAAFRD